MKKMFILAIAVVAMSTAIAQEKATKVKSKTKSETRAQANNGALKTDHSTTTTTRAEVNPSTVEAIAQNRKTALIEKVTSVTDFTNDAADASGHVVVNQTAGAAAEHGITVSTLATSPELVKAKGAIISEVASVKALEVSPKADNIKLGTSVTSGADVKANTSVKVKPVNVSTNVRIKNGMRVKL